MYALVCSFLIPPPKFKYLRNICKTKNKDQVATIGKYSKQVKVINKSPTQIPIQVIALKVKQKYLVFKMQNLLCGIFRYFVLTDSFANTFKKGHVLMRRSYRRGVSIQTVQYRYYKTNYKYTTMKIVQGTRHRFRSIGILMLQQLPKTTFGK